MSMINIDELNAKRNNNLLKKKEIYDDILKIVHRRIIKSSETNNDGYCFYNMPKFIYGIPLFNYKECLLYIVKALIKNGFEIKYTHPNLLYISWLGKTTNKEYKNKQSSENYKSITEYKPKKNLIYNSNLIKSLENNMNILKN